MSTVMERLLQTLSEITPEEVWAWFLGEPLLILVTILSALVLRWCCCARSVAWSTSRSPSTMPAATGSRVAPDGCSRRPPASSTPQTADPHDGLLLRSVITFSIALITVLTVMSIVGIPLAPLLASAGVGGVALGFGAQSLVKDFLSGIFMILEDQYGVGDVIDTGEAIGTVEEVSLRVTRLRDPSGVVWYVRNGEIIRIGNKSQGWSTAIVDIPVSYSENLEKVIPLIKSVVHQMDEAAEWQGLLLEEPQVVGWSP